MDLASFPARQGQQRSLAKMPQVLSWAFARSPGRQRQRSAVEKHAEAPGMMERILVDRFIYQGLRDSGRQTGNP
jgi:hypothetical protein